MKYVCKAKKACTVAIHSSYWRTESRYSIKGVYKKHKTQAEKTQWARYVWNRLPIPKHKLTLWMLLLDKLKAGDRLFQYGIGTNNLCDFCGTTVDTSAHLFFECTYSQIS